MDIHAFFFNLDKLYAAGEREGVESFLRLSLEEARREDGPGEISVLNELMGFYRNTGRMGEALSRAEEALLKTRALGLTENAAWGTTLLNAATAYEAAGKRERALELYREAGEIYREYLPPGDSRLAALYNNLSGLYGKQGNPAAAAETLLRALDIITPREERSVEEAIMRVNLANMYAGMGRDGEAREELGTAVSIYQERQGPEGKKDPHYAAALAALALCGRREGRYSEAAGLYEEALEEIQIHYGKNQNYYVICRNLAEVYQTLGENEKSARYLQIAESGPPGEGEP